MIKHFPLSFVILLFAVICSPSASFSQPVGNGKDGSPSISGVVNAYTPLISIICKEKIQVGNGSLFSPGDLVLVIQMQGAQINGSDSSTYGSIINYADAGNYEYSFVSAIHGNVLFLQIPLYLAYDTAGKVQVIRIPQYVNPVVTGTLTCMPWNGALGGVLALDATGTIVLQAGMDVSKTGFRGGQLYTGPDIDFSDPTYISIAPSIYADGTKGEGIAFNGLPPYTDGKGAPANGGGGGNSHTGGGGGGANYGSGGNGGWGYPADSNYIYSGGRGGHPLIDSRQHNVFMGGGGGAGSCHVSDFGDPADTGSSGANGGGIIIITADKMTGNTNVINAYGDSSLSVGTANHADGVGGGGGGGSVLLALDSLTNTIFINISGGNGGNTTIKGGGPGGGGGGGVCRLSSSGLATNIIPDTAGGIAGVSQGGPYGAVNGLYGGTLGNLVISLNPVVPNVKAAFNAAPANELGTNIVIANNSIGASSYQWNFGDGVVVDSSSVLTHTYLSPGIYDITLVVSDAMNCIDSTSQLIITNLTNVFTPNGDGKNDVFAFPNFDTENYSIKFEIYNRWGNLVFNGNDSNSKWDGTINGKKASEGTYYYIVEITDNINGTKSSKRGTVTLLR